MNGQALETTLYSLDESAPAAPERRTGERHLSLLRVGSMKIGDRRELCLIKNISAGGMLIRAYCTVPLGCAVSIELKQGEPIEGLPPVTPVAIAPGYSCADGIVTLEDLLESLVGDIRDEHDRTE